MNIFYLDINPVIAAQYLCDEHIVSQMKESCQMLSTCMILKYGISNPILMEVSYKNHPPNIWLRERDGNFKWLVKHLNALIEQYRIRFNPENNFSEGILRYKDILVLCLDLISTMPDNKFSHPPQCMPDVYRDVPSNTVEAYRRYYTSKQYTFKQGYISYARGVPIPAWLTDHTQIRTKLVSKEKKTQCYRPIFLHPMTK